MVISLNTLIRLSSSALLFTLAAAAQPYAYVANASGINVSVVNRATNVVVGSITTPQASVGLDVSPSGAELYIAHTGGVAIANLSTNRVIANIPLPSPPQNVAVSPNGAWAYATMPKIDKVAIIDTVARRLLTNLAVAHNPWGITFDPISTRAFVTEMYAG